MVTCPYCEAETDEKFNFCENCEQQIKCLSCERLLVRGKSKCLFCGTAVNDGHQVITGILNEYKYDEERTQTTFRRQVNLKFSDDAIDKVGKYLPGYIFPSVEIAPLPSNIAPITTVPALEAGHDTGIEDPQQIQPSLIDKRPDAQLNQYLAWIDQRVFKLGDRLEIKIIDFKGNSKQDQKRRFILVYVWGYQRHFNTPVPSRSPIIEAARKIKLWDTTFSHVITQLTHNFLVEDNEGGISLAPSTQSEVEILLSELQNSELKGYLYQTGKSARKSTAKPKSVDIEDSKVSDLVSEWLNNPIDLGGFDVRQLDKSKSRQKVEFGLWLLKSKLGVNQAPIGAVVKYVLQGYPRIGGNEQSLRNSANDKEFIGRTHKKECFLTAKGEAEILELLPDNLKN